MKVVAWLIGIATLVGAAVYATLSVVRWEWNRALFFGMVFVAAQIALATALLIRRLDAVADERPTSAPAPTGRGEPELATVRAARSGHVRFRWLHVDRTELVNRSSVFITLLVGGGVVLSGVAWVLDRVGAATTDRRREASLARDLAGIRYPHGGLLVDDATALAGARRERDVARLRALTGEP